MGNPQPSPYSLLVWGRFRDLMGVGPFGYMLLLARETRREGA